MTVTLRLNAQFPDTPYQMWKRGELDAWLGLPLSSQVDVIAGDAFVARATGLSDSETISRALAALVNADRAVPGARKWDVDLAAPSCTECFLVDVERFNESTREGVRLLRPGDLVLLLGITAPDSPPRLYGRPDVPFYLHIDRRPQAAIATLYLRGFGEFSWDFGETIRLPEPFDFALSTDLWRTF
jgi:hypothetical protein